MGSRKKKGEKKKKKKKWIFFWFMLQMIHGFQYIICSPGSTRVLGKCIALTSKCIALTSNLF